MLDLQESVELALEKSNLTEALDACFSLDGDKPDGWFFDACFKIAQAYRQQKHFESALSVYKKISLRWPSIEMPINCVMDKGHALREAGQVEQAASVYYSVICKQYANGWACLWYARCLVELQERQKAELVIESFLQNYPSNALPKSHLNIELCLTLLEISILERNAGLIERHFVACIQQFGESRQYQQNKLVVLISKLQDTQMACKYLYKLLLACWGNEQSIKSIATQFYYIDEPSTCIEALFMLSDLDSQPNHVINLLVACVCELHPSNRGYFWKEAQVFLSNYYLQQKPNYGYWSYYHDLFGGNSVKAIQNGRNINTGIENTLKDFAVTYWYQRQHSAESTEVIGRSSAYLPHRIVVFSKGQIKQTDYAPNIAENIAGKFQVEHFNTLSASSFITQHYTNKVYKAWRLCRSEADKEALFKLCYLVKFGGVVLSNSSKITETLIQMMHENQWPLVLGKGYMGISAKIVAAVPNHPLLVAILNYAIQNLLNRSRLPSSYTTGSLCWAKAYCEYVAVIKRRGKPLDVHVLSAREVEAILQ